MLKLIAFALILAQGYPRVGPGTAAPHGGGGSCTDGSTSGLLLRLEPESISGCGSFTTWPDTSGTANNATMSASTTCSSTGGSNGGPYVTIGSQHGTITPLSAVATWTVLSVDAPSSTTKGKLTENSSTGGAFAAYTSTTDGADIGATTPLGNGSATITPNAWRQWGVTYNASTGPVTYYVNSTTDGTFTQTGSITNTIDRLFDNNSNSEQWSGKTEGLLIFNRVLSGAEVAVWQAYFVCKRGVS